MGNAAKPTKEYWSFNWQSSTEGISHLAFISESLPPEDELRNNIVTETISNNRHLFHIVTPIKITRLMSLLINHPNPSFIALILRGLKEGFWPWADTQREVYPITKDYYKACVFKDSMKNFLQDQCD